MPAAKISTEMITKITQALAAGHYREVACKLAGIDRKTLLNWMKRGERDKSGLYHDLYNQVNTAEAEAEAYHLSNIHTAAEKSWFASAWFLERKHPERWSKYKQHAPDDHDRDTLVILA